MKRFAVSIVLIFISVEASSQNEPAAVEGCVIEEDGTCSGYAAEDLILDPSVLVSDQSQKSVTMERIRINPSSSLAYTTGSVLEVIRSAASVTVDGDDNVSIRGNGNVLILVDGVPVAPGGLSAIPAANVQSIDIMASPDVKYDSEGTGGIISIVSKKQPANAFNAMASFNYGFNGFLNGNFAMSFNKGRWGLRMNYNGKYERDRIESELHRQIKSTGNTIDQTVSAVKRTGSQTAGLNATFKATERDVLTVDFKAGFPRLNNFQDFDNRYVSGGVQSVLFRQTDITFNRETFEGSFDYRHIFEPEKTELDVVAAVSSITGHRPSFYYEDGVMVQRSESGGHPFNASLQADYMTKAGNGKIGAGAKMTFRQNNIDHKMFECDPLTGSWAQSVPLSNDLQHREYIPAAYAMYSQQSGNGSFFYKAGVRVEYSHVTLHSVKEALDSQSDGWFVAPEFLMTWYTGAWTLTFELSRRISRPTYPQLNPYINLIDNQTYETGNVRLQPEKANKADFGYSYNIGKIKLDGNAYLTCVTGNINQVAGIMDNVLTMTYINGDRDIKAGIDHNLRFRHSWWFSMDLSTNTFYSDTKGTYNNVDIRNCGWVNSSNVTLTFKPAYGMNIRTQYYVTTPQRFPQFTTRTVHYGNVGISQTFLNRALTISATLTDVFNTRRWDLSSDNSVYSVVNNSRNRSRMMWLGITWNFNSYKPLDGQRRSPEEDRSVIRLGD